MLTLALLAGLWTTGCIQTQMAPDNHGFVTESYAITEKGDFEFTREWFRDRDCTEAAGQDVETGVLELGKKMTGMFISGITYEANFTSDLGTDMGAVALGNGRIKVGRGTKNLPYRNTMVGVFEYKKQQ